MTERSAASCSDDRAEGPVDTLRLGVVIESTSVPGWAAHVLEQLEANPGFDWITTVVDPAPRAARPTLAVRAYEALDARRYARLVDDAALPCDVGDRVGRRPRSTLAPDPPAAPLLLDLRPIGAGPLPPSDSEVWWVETGAPPGRSWRPSGFWAFADRAPALEVRLFSRRPGSESRVLVVGATAVNPASLTVTRSAAAWRGASLVLQALAARRTGGQPLGSRSRPLPTPPSHPPRANAATVTRLVARRFRDAASNAARARRVREQWVLGLRTGPHATSELGNPLGFVPVTPPPDRSWGDPFVVSDDSGTWVFFEEALFASGRGTIAVARLEDHGLGEPCPVLERPHHLSFPHVFRYGDSFYLLPESAAAGTVELYRAVEFPYRWELERVLLEGVRALDTTILVDDGRCWLFTCLEIPGRNRHDELHLYWSNSLQGPWRPHPGNPVAADVRWARAAGRLFHHRGNLIRPAQDCSGRYGQAVVFRRVLTLTERDYLEETVARLEPVWTAGLLGTHTYNADGGVAVVDGVRTIPRQRRELPTDASDRHR